MKEFHPAIKRIEVSVGESVRILRELQELSQSQRVETMQHLAVSLQDQGRCIGTGLLQDAIRRTLIIAEQAGIRAMLTHPINEEAARFYTRFGFAPRPKKYVPPPRLLRRYCMVDGENNEKWDLFSSHTLGRARR